MTPEEQRAGIFIARLHRAMLGQDVGIYHEVAFHDEMPWEGGVELNADAVAWLDDLLERGGYQ